MAKPRIFISSTYYDLKFVRADLERFIKDKGFDPVLFEKGHVPYGNEKPLEEYCYREIELCEILVCIVGGKFGTEAKDGTHSITQNELKSAIEHSKQIYVFVEKPVVAEFRTYQRNKESNINWAAVDDKRVYEFLDELYGLPIGNPVFPFESSADITSVLQEQWAGLFQRLLSEVARQKVVRLVADLSQAAGTLNQLVTYLTEDKKNTVTAIRQILQENHPIFKRLEKLLKVPYRVFFTNLTELKKWIAVRGFVYHKPNATGEQEWHSWTNEKEKVRFFLRCSVFDKNGRLETITPSEWKEDALVLQQLSDASSDSVDDLPF